MYAEVVVAGAGLAGAPETGTASWIVGGFRVQGTVGIVEASFTRGYLKDLRGAFGELLTRGVFLDPAFLNARLNLLNLPPLSDS